MINEVSNTGSPLSQTQKHNKDIQPAGQGTVYAGAVNVQDVVEISGVKPVQPVTDEKNEINSSSDAKNAEKDIQAAKGREESSRAVSESQSDNQKAGRSGQTEGSTDQLSETVNSAYNPKETEIGKVLNEVA